MIESDATGTIRFRAEDLRKMGTIAVVDGAGSKWDLSDEQMRELLEDYRLDFVWK